MNYQTILSKPYYFILLNELILPFQLMKLHEKIYIQEGNNLIFIEKCIFSDYSRRSGIYSILHVLLNTIQIFEEYHDNALLGIIKYKIKNSNREKEYKVNFNGFDKDFYYFLHEDKKNRI